MCVALAAAALAVGVAAASAGANLARRHEQWLRAEVPFVLSDVERTAFLDLASDRDRDAFVHAFWEARNPTPGTRTNSYREEHDRRMAQAGKLFSVDRSRSGATSARGRAWVTLGRPHDRRIYSELPGLVAIEDWLYHGDPALGLPAMFHVVFRRDAERGDFVLWDPTRDDLGLLAVSPKSAAEVREVLQANAMDLTEALRSLATVEALDARPEHVASSSSRLLSRLADIHNLMPFDLSYLESIASGSGPHSDRRTLPARVLFHGAFDRDGRPTMHYVIEVPPEALTLEPAEDRLRGGLRVVGWVRPVGSTRLMATLDEYVDLSLSESEFEKVKSFPFAFEDAFPVRPGEYVVDLWVRDLVSLAWSNLTARFEVPPESPVDAPRLRVGGVLPVAQSVASDRAEDRPFGFAGQVVYPSFEVPPSGDLVAIYQVLVPPGVAEPLKVRYVIASETEDLIGGFDRLPVNPAGGVAIGTVRTALRGLPGGDYRLQVAVETDDAEAAGDVPFRIGGAPRSLPWLVVRQRGERAPGFAIGLVRQALAAEDAVAARRAVSVAVGQPSAAAEARLLGAWLALETGEAARAVELLQPLVERPGLAAIAREGLALAAEALGDRSAALDAWRQAVRLVPGSPLYHARRGRAAHAMGEAEEARSALARAVALEPGRVEDEALLGELTRAGFRPEL